MTVSLPHLKPRRGCLLLGDESIGVRGLSSAGDDYPKWLGWAAVVAGLIGLLAASIIFFDGFSSFTTNVLFPISSLLFTVWVGVMGYMLWQKTGAPVAKVGTQPAA